jgi:hypothetical protein
VLRQIFETTGHVQSVKIIPDKTVSSPSVRYTSGRAASLYLCRVAQSGSILQ